MRREVRQRVAALTEIERARAATKVRGILSEQQRWRDARSILFYAALPDELDIRPLLELGLAMQKLVALPRYDSQSGQYCACEVRNLAGDLTPGRYGVQEPSTQCGTVPLNQLDFVLVPGVAFDLSGRRLGRGKGFYDRLLGAVRGTTCGIAFDEQIVPCIPVEPHDSDVNCILTPTRWIEL
jgi:5-formyltetrahydrofolate cyclo-ligase